MKDHWVIRYDGLLCGEWETTWEGHNDLHDAVQRLKELTKDGWRDVFMN